MVFFGGPPYLFRSGVVGKAGHDRAVLAAQNHHARIADEVQAVARRQDRVPFLTHGVRTFFA